MLRLRFAAQTAFLAFAFCAQPQQVLAQRVDSEKINNLKSQQTSIENRIADLQREVDDAYAGKTYCSAEERTEDYNRLRALQRKIAALRKEYAQFKAGFIKMAASQTAGPQFDAAGIHPDERSYWNADDNALAKLQVSVSTKAARVEQATIRDCNGKTSATSGPATQSVPAQPPSPANAPAPPAKPQSPPKKSTPPAGGPRPGTGCTENEGTERRLQIQDEILRLEAELIPIDGTKPEGRARQNQLIREIDRLGEMLKMDCPPLIQPQAPVKVDNSHGMAPVQSPPFKNGSKVETGTFATRPTSATETRTAKQEYDAIGVGWAGLALAFAERDGCDQQQLQNYIAGLEHLAASARALAGVSKEVGEFSTINAGQAQKLAENIQRHIDEAKQFSAVDCPAGVRFRLNPWDGKILAIHNQERAAIGVQPLHWDPVLAAHATSYAQALARTGQLTHAPREGRGIERENLGEGRLGWSPEQIATQEWVSEKRYFHAGYFPNVCEGGWSTCAHYSQMIWETTTDVGCGYATGAGFSWLVCRYSPGGNKDGQPVGYRDPSTYRGGPLEFNPTYSPMLKGMRPVNVDRLEFGDEAVAEWKNFEYARGRCSVPAMSSAVDKLKYYAQAAHEHSAEEHSKGNDPGSGAYDAMAKQIDERVQDASLYRDACARNPYHMPERG